MILLAQIYSLELIRLARLRTWIELFNLVESIKLMESLKLITLIELVQLIESIEPAASISLNKVVNSMKFNPFDWFDQLS